MIDGSEKRKLQLAFEIQSSRVFQKRSNLTQIMLGLHYFNDTGKNPYSGVIQLNNLKATS